MCTIEATTGALSTWLRDYSSAAQLLLSMFPCRTAAIQISGHMPMWKGDIAIVKCNKRSLNTIRHLKLLRIYTEITYIVITRLATVRYIDEGGVSLIERAPGSYRACMQMLVVCAGLTRAITFRLICREGASADLLQVDRVPSV
jgi:hypothetical protein